MLGPQEASRSLAVVIVEGRQQRHLLPAGRNSKTSTVLYSFRKMPEAVRFAAGQLQPAGVTKVTMALQPIHNRKRHLADN